MYTSPKMVLLLSMPGESYWIIILLIIIILLLVIKLFPAKNLQDDKIPISETILSSLLLISFFLPWISKGVFFTDLSVSGFEIPSKLKQFIDSSDTISANGENNLEIVYISYLLYAIPIFSFASIILGLNKKTNSSNYLSRVASAIPVLVGTLFIVSLIFGRGEDVLQYLDIGFYLTILFGIALWLSAIISGRNPIIHPKNEYSSEKATDNGQREVDKSSLLTQLSQLHSLKEKNVITEEIYEQERQTILSKLQNQQSFEGNGESV